jgi:protein ImuB
VFFACIYVPNFLAQAAVRLDPTAAASPFAVVAGDRPQVRVLALDDCLYGL